MMNMETERIKELETVLRRLLGIGFRVHSEIDGDASCFYCNAYLEGGEEHEDDCPYFEAKHLLGDKSKILSDWISVEDRLPEKLGCYLVHFQSGDLTSWSYNDQDTGFNDAIYSQGPITHWQPLPSPPVIP